MAPRRRSRPSYWSPPAIESQTPVPPPPDAAPELAGGPDALAPTAPAGSIDAGAGTAREVTARGQAEDDQRFLLDLGAGLARLADPAEIGRAAARALGERLGLSRCFFCDVDLARDVYVIRGMEYDAGGADGTPNPSSLGEWPIGIFGPHVRADALAGRATVVGDTRADARTAPHHDAVYGPQRVGAYVHLPLRRAGTWIAALLVDAAGPRPWTDQEVALAREVADRAWPAVENARLVAAERAARAAAEDAYALLQDQTAELEATNQQLQDQAAELEAQAQELRSTTE